MRSVPTAEVFSAIALCGIWSDNIRSGIDFLGRLGGEEFAIWLPQTKLHGGVSCSENLRQRVVAHQLELVDQEAPAQVKQHTISISIGVCAIYLDDNSSIKEVIADADKALFTAKQNGRNRVEVFRRNWSLTSAWSRPFRASCASVAV